MSAPESDAIDLSQRLGAEPGESHEVLVLYIPDRDRDGNELGDQRRWVLEAAKLLAEIGGGVSVEPPIEGGWLDAEHGRIIWERPVRVFTYVHPDSFVARIDELRSFLHRLGRVARQGEVAVEFAGRFWRIQRFDVS